VRFPTRGVSGTAFRRGYKQAASMKTAFHILFSIAFVLGLASSVLANVP
jgi:hypothetical protein